MRWVLRLANGKWRDAKFSAIRKGDIFKVLDEHDKHIVTLPTAMGTDTWTAAANASMVNNELVVDCGEQGVVKLLSADEQDVVNKAIENQKQVINRINAGMPQPDAGGEQRG